MSGTIVFAVDEDWSVSSGLFNWVVPFLIDRVRDPTTRDRLALIDEQNFRWLDVRELSVDGRREVLTLLADELAPFAREHLPEGPRRAELVELVRRLGAMAAGARSGPRGAC